MFDLLSFLKSIAASATTTMKNTDPKTETTMTSQDICPKITHKPWKETDYSLKIKHKASELDNYYTTYMLAGQAKENTSGYVNIASFTSYIEQYIFPV